MELGRTQGDYTDWPDLLAKRLASERGPLPLAVVNEGIGGNRILRDGAGVSALARLDRDVLAQPGIVSLIVLEGINDIGWPHMKPKLPNGTIMKEAPFASELVTTQEVLMGLQQIIERAHQHGIRVFGATLTPYEGADYYSEDGEADASGRECSGFVPAAHSTGLSISTPLCATQAIGVSFAKAITPATIFIPVQRVTRRWRTQ